MINIKQKISQITIVIVSYKSEQKVLDIVKENKNLCNILIVDNSNNENLKQKIIKFKKKNINIILSKNIGYGNAANLASKYIKTKYFVLTNPDVLGINCVNLKKFTNKVKNLGKFGSIGPRYIGKNHKNLIQTTGRNEIEKLNCISGAVMFFETQTFKKLKGFDKNFFLYYEENDFCFRANRKKHFNYQLNSIKVKHENGNSVKYSSKNERLKTNILRTWHFAWSKIYYLKKNHNYFYALSIGLIGLIRSFVKMVFFNLRKNKIEYIKYHARFNAIINSICDKKAYFRLSDVEKYYDL
jgi:N-acetylglucosaminyl-diphospho-decaprenol L-rhamnosyltransferase